MARYLILSALIVFGVAIAVAGWVNRDLIRIKIASVYARVPPKPEPFADPATRTRLSRESSHFDAALGWLRTTGRVSHALSLAIELWPIW